MKSVEKYQSNSSSSEEKNNSQSLVWEIILQICQSHELGQKILHQLPLPGGYKGHKSQTFKITTDKGDLFIKMDDKLETYSRFEHEKESLKVINKTVFDFVPNFLVMGKLPNQGAFLITSYLSLEKSCFASLDTQISLAQKLVQLHQNKSPNGKFGFTHGFSRKPNDWKDGWEVFFKENRWQPLFQRCLEKYPQDKELKKRGQIILDKIIPYLLGDLKVEPTLLHGDLWSGCWGVNSETKKPVIFSPQSYYGHNEMELSILTMFGGSLEAEFFQEYHKYHPQQEPNFVERKSLYKLYHYLNHYYLLGSSSRNSCLDAMKELCQRLESRLLDKEKVEEVQIQISPK